MSTATTIPIELDGNPGSGHATPRWKWTGIGVAIGTITAAAGFVQQSVLGVGFILVGLVIVGATLVAFLIAGPTQTTKA